MLSRLVTILHTTVNAELVDLREASARLHPMLLSQVVSTLVVHAMIAARPITLKLILAIMSAHVVHKGMIVHFHTTLRRIARTFCRPTLKSKPLKYGFSFNVSLTITRSSSENMRVGAFELHASTLVLSIVLIAVDAEQKLALVSIADTPHVRQW